MSDITRVNTGAVIGGAETILAEASAFKAAFDDMYNTIHELRNTWTSSDGNAYIARIDSYEEDFTSMFSRLVTSAEGIRQVAEDYSATVRKNML